MGTEGTSIDASIVVPIFFVVITFVCAKGRFRLMNSTQGYFDAIVIVLLRRGNKRFILSFGRSYSSF